MSRAKLIALALGLAFIALLATPASAQDGPTLTVEPANVDAAGEHEFVVAGTGWTAAPPLFVLPCVGASNLEDLTAAGADACDISNLTPVTPTDGAFESSVTYDVPAEGMCITAADAAQTEVAAVCISVGAAADEAGEGAEGEGEEAATDTAEEELANTGAESGLLVVVGVAVAAAGALTVGYTRRFA